MLDSGAARVAQMSDPRKVRIMLGSRVAWSEVWENNPRIAKPDQVGDFQVVFGRSQSNNMRPYHSAKSPTRWVYNLDYRPTVGELYFTDAEREFGARHAGSIIIEQTIKPGASPNKQWGRWAPFVALCKAAGIELHQMAPLHRVAMPDVKVILTPTFRHACAVLAHARACVVHEGGLSHAAAALDIPGVVIFGGFTPVELTGYPVHRNLGVSLGEACGMRLPCKHCEAEMARITPGRVLDELQGVLNAA